MRVVSAVVIGLVMALAACGSDDDDSEKTATSTATTEATTTSAPEDATALEGTWRTDPITVTDMEGTLSKAGLGKHFARFEQNAPISDDPTALILDVGDDWDLYGQARSEPRTKIDFDAQFEVRGDTVVVTHSTGTSNTLRWSVRGDVLELTWLKGTAPRFRGIPDEAYQRALYMTADFHRAP
jgi:hypothetical protein